MTDTPEDIDHDYTKEIVCPYCGHEQSDSWEIMGNDEDGETDCDECEKSFRWSAHIDITYCTEKMENAHV